MQGYFAQATTLATARKCGVLVADDEPAIRSVLNFGLQQEGFSVWLAADGQQALDVYRSHCETIDVVLLDVRMPCLDGPATLVALQELKPQIPCCFLNVDRSPVRAAAAHDTLYAPRSTDGPRERVLC